MDVAQCGSIVPKHAHDVIAPQQAVELVSERLGVAILTQPSPTSFHADGVVVKPLSDTSLCFKTCVIMRADNTSRLIDEYVRMFLRRYSSQRLPPKEVKLSSSAQVLGWKTPIPRSRYEDSIAGTDNSPCLRYYRKTIPALLILIRHPQWVADRMKALGTSTPCPPCSMRCTVALSNPPAVLVAQNVRHSCLPLFVGRSCPSTTLL